MLIRATIGTIAVTALMISIATAQVLDNGKVLDDGKYPKFSGLWRAVNLGVGGQAAFDPTKPWGRGQQAPLTPEYQAIHEASMADQANGGQGNRHAGDDDCIWRNGNRRPAGDNLYPGQSQCRRQPPHLHRRARLAAEGRTELSGLF